MVRCTYLIVLMAGLSMAGENGLVLKGVTRTGLTFEGTVIASGEDHLKIRPLHQQAFLEVGIPLADVARLDLVPQAHNQPLSLQQIELLRPLLRHLSTAGTEVLVKWLRGDVVKGEWEWRYHWSTTLLEARDEPALKCSIALLQVECLKHLGLFARLEARLDELNSIHQPLEAPVGLCHLNAFVAERNGRWEEVYFWARLAFVRIPSLPPGKGATLQELADRSLTKLTSTQP